MSNPDMGWWEPKPADVIASLDRFLAGGPAPESADLLQACQTLADHLRPKSSRGADLLQACQTLADHLRPKSSRGGEPTCGACGALNPAIPDSPSNSSHPRRSP